MFRATKTNQSSFNLSILNSSAMTGISTAENMQREIDNYTRRLEQDKRKFFRAHENYSEIKKQYDHKNKQLDILKSKQNKSEMINLKGKISMLQAGLDQTINSYNESLAKNNKLKLEIDEIRKEKKNENQKLKFLTQTLLQTTKEIQKKQYEIQNKKSIIQRMKESIIMVRVDNQALIKKHEQEIQLIKYNFDRTGKEEDRRQKEEKNIKSQSIDTQPLLKLRLKNLMSKNKQKIKIIDQYKRNMHLIYQNFEEIKQESGIDDLQEITKTFLKQQEHNLLIYQYMSRLNSNIELLKEGNQEIRQKILEQQEANTERRLNLTGTPEQAKRKRDMQAFKEQKLKVVSELKSELQLMEPRLQQLFKVYSLVGVEEQFELNLGNVEMCIGKVEEIISKWQASSQPVYRSEFKEEMTRYSKLPPGLNEDLKDKVQQKILEQEKLKQLAGEFWEKKKAAKITFSKNQQFND